MIKPIRIVLLALLGFGAGGVAFAAADATPHQIYEAAQAGRVAEAQQMIDQVLRDHPQSAQAHFVAAELAARVGDFPSARQQLATARQLDPTEAFANPRARSELERQLTGIRALAPPSELQSQLPGVRRSSVPWGLIAVLAVGAFIVWSILRARARQAYAQNYGPGALPPGNPGMQPGYGYGPGYPPQGGSGLMGNLASGLAIGAGVVAGEELVRHVIGGNSVGSGVASAADLPEASQNQDMGGADFGTPGCKLLGQ
ncbi:MAG: tetratricopeptide repeat protein [Steroidobacteraceae bacterium]